MSQNSSGTGRKRGGAAGRGGRAPARSAPETKAAAPAAPQPAEAAAAETRDAVVTTAAVETATAPPPAPATPAPAAEVAPKAAAPTAPAPAAPKAAAEPVAEPAEATVDADMERFEQAHKRYGPAYAAMAEGLRGEGVDKVVKLVQYGLAGAAAFVVIAAIFSA